MPSRAVKQQPASKPAKRTQRQSAAAPVDKTRASCLGRTLKWGAGFLAVLVGCGILLNLGSRAPNPQQTAMATTTVPTPTATREAAAPESTSSSLRSAVVPLEASAIVTPALATNTPLPTHTPSLTPTNTPTNTPLPTPTLASAGPVVNTNANVRGGPGTDFPIMASAQPGQELVLIGQDSTGQWLQLANGYWIAASLVNNIPPNLPITAIAAQLSGSNPTPAPTAASAQETAPTATPSWRRVERGIIFTSECPCDQGNILNCGDFRTAMDAQACYMRCMDLAGRDVHGLDRDKDGNACEWSW